MKAARLFALLSLAATLVFFAVVRFSRSAAASKIKESTDIAIQNQPASEGRAITPAGALVMDTATFQPAVGALPVAFIRSPDRDGRDGRGRYLVAVCSGFGVQFNAASNRAMQSLMVIDLNAQPAPAVIQNVYFPTPQSAHVGAVFSAQPDADGSFALYVSGGFENKIWVFKFKSGEQYPVSPAPKGLPAAKDKIEASSIDLSTLANKPANERENHNKAQVYPTGLALSPDGETLFVANNLGDSLGVVTHPRDEKTRRLTKIDLHAANPREFVYPYGVAATTAPDGKSAAKVYVSCWNTASIAVINLSAASKPKFIAVGRHPTQMIFNKAHTRLYVANSNADSVSVIDTQSDKEIERINTRVAEDTRLGSSPEGLALSDDETTLYVANAHSNSIAVIKLNDEREVPSDEPIGNRKGNELPSKLLGLIPTGQYPSAVAFADGALFVGNGKGTGVENSSLVVNNSGRAPNAPNDRFPAGAGRGSGAGGEYSVALVVGNISRVPLPDERGLMAYTQAVMRNNRLLGAPQAKLFSGASPFKHIIYVIKENRTYDQVFGDIEKSGDGSAADGDKRLAIFGAGDAARPASGASRGAAQNITPNAHALALRFGLFDRFFVNAEASPDGHNWSTAAFSSDYVDKAYRWDYSGRGRSYDYEGFNRLPDFHPLRDKPPLFKLPVDAKTVAEFVRGFAPDVSGWRDVGEPDSLYLWDACARAGLTYRNYGEFIATLSEKDLAAINANKSKSYPDTSATVSAFAAKRTLENHHSQTYRNFDLKTPDAMTVDSYRAAKQTNGNTDALISRTNANERFRGVSRIGEWLAEFNEFVGDQNAGRADRMPNLSILRVSNDHTAGVAANQPTPQFHVADNDYAVGRLVEAVSNSPYWRDTAIFILEDDAQDGPDHVDAHRSPVLVISAYNRPGALIHDFHNTVSLIRTMEILLGLPPMNALDAAAVPMKIFRDEADMTPYKAALPDVAFGNLLVPNRKEASAEESRLMRLTDEQDFTHADLADARELNEIIWRAIRGAHSQTPSIAHLPVYDAMRLGILERARRTRRASKQRQVEQIEPRCR